MEFPKFSLCWNGSRVKARWRLGLFGTYTRGEGLLKVSGVVISMRGVLAWAASLAVAAYFIGAAALWFWLERRPYNYVTYADLVLPTRWSGVDALRGRAMIDEGLDDIKARRWGEGLQKLRIGIARYPEEIKGRMVLADLFLAMKARRQAIETYDGGLATRYPGRAYLEAMMRTASQAEDYEWWLRTCDRALELAGEGPSLTDDRRWLVLQKLAALLAADRADEALKLAEAEGETNSPSIAEFRVLALLKAGRAADAVAFLDEWAGMAEGRRVEAQVLRLRVRACREAGDIAGMDRALEEMRAQAPTNPRPYVYAVVQNAIAGREDKAAAELDQFLLRFGSRPKDLLVLAEPLAETGEVALLERVLAHARRQGFAMPPFRRFMTESLMARGDWRGAAGQLALMEAEIDPAKDRQAAFWHDVTDALVQAALDAGEGTQSTLVSKVRGRQFTLAVYKEMIRRLRAAGRPATARQLVTFAQGVYPKNKDIEAWRMELDGELAAAARPAAEPLVRLTPADGKTPDAAVARREPVDEEAFFEQLKARESSPTEALRLIRDMRRARPDWLGAKDVELQRIEVRLNGRAGDVLGLRSAARLYLTGERLRSAQMIEVARELHDAGRKDEAVLLVREIAAKSPDYTFAAKLLEQWVPKPAAADAGK